MRSADKKDGDEALGCHSDKRATEESHHCLCVAAVAAVAVVAVVVANTRPFGTVAGVAASCLLPLSLRQERRTRETDGSRRRSYEGLFQLPNPIASTELDAVFEHLGNAAVYISPVQEMKNEWWRVKCIVSRALVTPLGTQIGGQAETLQADPTR